MTCRCPFCSANPIVPEDTPEAMTEEERRLHEDWSDREAERRNEEKHDD